VHERVVKAGLIACDAGVDLVGAVGLDLEYPVGIGYRDQLHLSVAEDLFSCLRH
jgi:hypothetical protein